MSPIAGPLFRDRNIYTFPRNMQLPLLGGRAQSYNSQECLRITVLVSPASNKRRQIHLEKEHIVVYYI